MNDTSSLNFTYKNSQKRNLKLYLFILLFMIIILFFIFFKIFTYKHLMNEFITSFNDNKFSIANNLIITKENTNPFKSIFIKHDLSKYFSNKIDDIHEKTVNNELTKNEALSIILEIKRYSILDSEVNNSIETFTTNQNFINAITYYNNHKFKEAYDSFSLVKEFDPIYESAQSYITECRNTIKYNLIETINELCENDYYSKALDEINKHNYILGNDSEINSKINDINTLKSEYLSKHKTEIQTTSSSLVNNISINTINSLGLESLTPYLIHVDINNQKTNIYNGSKNKWNLIKSYDCSTGVKGKDTPKGSFTIKEKGDWFFSDKYKQGGKYWVQFSGDYLFHSLPYDKTKTTIVDYTLGKPASHGCIRLEENNCKWIYENVPQGSKVIIK